MQSSGHGESPWQPQAGGPKTPPAMTRKQIDVSIYVFIVLLIAFFGRAVWGVMGMVGWV